MQQTSTYLNPVNRRKKEHDREQFGCIGFLARCLFGVLHFTYHVIILIILLLVLALFWLPIIGEFKGAIEEEISDYLGSPVTIGKILFKTEKNKSHWVFKNIQLHDQQGKKALMRLNEFSFSLDHIESLRTVRFQPEKVSAKGGHLTLIQAPNGDLRVDGLKLPLPGFNSGAGRNTALILDLQAIDVHWINEKNKKSLAFNHNHLYAVITPLEIIADMSLYPPKSVAKPIKLKTHLFYQGDNVDQQPQTTDELLWDGKVSLAANIRDLSALPIDLAKNTGLHNAKIDIDAEGIIQQGDFRHLKGKLLLADALWVSAKEVAEPLVFNGEWLRTKKGWSLNAAILADKKPQQKKADQVNLQLKQILSKEYTDYIANIDQMNLSRYLPILEKQQWLTHDIKDYISQAQPRGQLENVDLNIRLPNQLSNDQLNLSQIKFSGEGALHNLSLNEHDYHPPIKQLNLNFKVDERQGQIAFDINNSAINYPAWFKKPIPLDQLRGTLQINKKDTWQLSLNDFYLKNPDFQIAGGGDVKLLSNNQLYADLTLNFHSRRVIKNISDYIPKIMSPMGQEWLNESLFAANISRGELILKGNLNDLPFDQTEIKAAKQGKFYVAFDVDQVKMKPLEGWSSIHGLKGRIAFTNGAMQAEIAQGRLMKTRLVGGQISIPTFREESRIHVKNLTVAGKLNDMVAIIQASPLGERSADFFDSTTLAGKGRAAINVKAAFNNALHDKEGIMTAIYLDTKNATLNFKAAKQQFDNINGQIYFHDKGIEAENIKLDYRGKTAILSAKTSQDKRYLDLTLKQTNQLSALLKTQETLRDLLSPFIKGDINYQADVRLPSYSFEAQQAKRAIQIQLTSTLENTESHLPPPLNKGAGQKQPLLLTIFQPFDKHKTAKYTVDYSQKFSLLYEDEPLRASVVFNQAKNELPPAGLHVSGKLNYVNALPWLAAYQKIAPILAKDKEGGQLMPVNIDLSIKQLDIGEYQQGGSHFVLEMKKNQQGRLALINDKSELIARFSPHFWQIEGDHIDFDAINAFKEEKHKGLSQHNKTVGKQTEQAKKQGALLKGLPNLSLNCQYCFIKGLFLHDLTIKTQRQHNAIAIQQLSANNQDFSLNAQGHWQILNDQETQTQLFVDDLTIQRPQHLLQSLGSEMGVANGEIKLTGQLAWQDSPLALSLNTLKGTLLLNIAAGRFTDADAGFAKILGLLNISRLGQRLRLDFSDISGKGIAFDGIQGHLQFNHGKLSTQDLILQSSVMLAGIQGDMDLRQQQFNHTLSVIPDVKSSLPVVSALFGGLGLGAAVALLDRLTDQQDKQTQLNDETLAMRYKITGTWDEPVIEAIESTTADTYLDEIWE